MNSTIFKIAFAAAFAVTPCLSAFAQEEAHPTQLDSLKQEISELRSELDENNAKMEAINYEQKQKKIWSRQKSFNIGYVNSSWKPKNCDAFDPNYGVSLSLVKTYFVHKKPLGGMVRIGIDAKWFDITYSNLEANPDWAAKYGQGGDDYGYDYDYGYEDEPEEFEANLGSHQIDAGIGVGVSAVIAPFSKMSNMNLAQLKAGIYFHVTPTFSAVLIDEPDDDVRFNYAFVPYLNFGGYISWKALSIFVEGRWGSANYHLSNSGESDDSEDESFLSFDRISAKNSGVRFGIGLRF